MYMLDKTVEMTQIYFRWKTKRAETLSLVPINSVDIYIYIYLFRILINHSTSRLSYAISSLPEADCNLAVPPFHAVIGHRGKSVPPRKTSIRY